MCQFGTQACHAVPIAASWGIKVDVTVWTYCHTTTWTTIPAWGIATRDSPQQIQESIKWPGVAHNVAANNVYLNVEIDTYIKPPPSYNLHSTLVSPLLYHKNISGQPLFSSNQNQDLIPV